MKSENPFPLIKMADGSWAQLVPMWMQDLYWRGLMKRKADEQMISHRIYPGSALDSALIEASDKKGYPLTDEEIDQVARKTP